MVHAADILLSLTVPVLILTYLSAAPYSKVEESFNTQAVHDIITYGIPSPFDHNAQTFLRLNYDHVSFPGSVPRTFVGAVFLSSLASPVAPFFSSPAQVQLLVRAILGLLNALALVRFRHAVEVAAGKTAARFYIVFIATQFHVIFYASRLLPNMFAFPLTNEAFRALIQSLSSSPKLKRSSQRRRLALYLLAVAAIVFRSEIALLLATVALSLLLSSGLSLEQEAFPSVLAAGLIALPITAGLDTFLWRPRISPSLQLNVPRLPKLVHIPLWPEAQAFLFNTVQGQSSEWGTSPLHHYFSSALPKLLLNPVTYLLCIPTAIWSPALRPISSNALLPTLLFVALYSLLPHKEWRFIVYVIPPLTAVAAGGASYIYTRRNKAVIYRVLSSLIILSVPLSFVVSCGLLYTSTLNYPGGQALARLHTLASTPSSPIFNFTSTTLANRRRIRVHLDNLALQTGVTRFQEVYRESKWEYDKTDDEARLHDVAFWEAVDLVITEAPERAIGSWDVVDTIEGFDGIGLRLTPNGQRVREDTSGRGKVSRDVLVPFAETLLGARRAAALEESVAAFVGSYTRGYWPHVRVRTRLFLLKRTKVAEPLWYQSVMH